MNVAPVPKPSVVCFGEILWDFLPSGAFPGGAPFNVAYHLQGHGLPAAIVSAVGRDVLGDELLRRVASWGLPTETIARHERLGTGYVRAHIGALGDAHYEIIPDVAWDEIPATPATLQAVSTAGAFIFGSLAQRTTANRAALTQLLAALPATALRVFDVNLRPPHDDLALVRTLAAQATILKLNSEEAARLAHSTMAKAPDEKHARQIAAETGCKLIVVTAGPRGAGLLRDGVWLWEPAHRVAVVDTVGSGDAFLAALVDGLLAGLSDTKALARACRLGEWVASNRGATPAYDATTPR